MSSATVPTLVALTVQVGIGLAVFQANRHRLANQCFVLLSLAIVAWLGSLYLAFVASTPEIAEFAIRQASASGALYLAMFNLIRLSIRQKPQGWRDIFRHSKTWLVATAGIVILCQTKLFLKGAQIHAPGTGAPTPVYGEGINLYAIYFVVALIVLVISYWRDIRITSGGERAELTFILIGGIAGTILSLLLTFVLGTFVDQSRLIWFAPFRIIIFSLIIAYGIATRKILEVGFFLRRTMAYVLLVVYLLLLYSCVWSLVDTVFAPLVPNDAKSLAHVAAALVVAFAMAPARGISQRLADRLLVGSHRLDFQATMKQAAAILQSVTTVADLLQRFGETIADAVETDRVFILLPDKSGFSQQYPPVESGSRYRLQITRDQPTITQLESNREPIVMHELHRTHLTPRLQRVMRQLDSLQIAVAMGIFARDQLAGVLLLGPRKSGRIYGTVEQNALQVLCGQLAVAIENAELFTEVQNAKIYNETLLQNLTSGVIAVGTDERITVFNNEAGEITRLNSQKMLDRPLDELPDQLREPLRRTLRTGESQENQELALESGRDGLVIRASTSIFHGQDGQVLGALMLLTDITAIRRLELQIRRSDRLASLGTLSAGMAHEIKNPLVSIKTFAQLLPERYQDSDFRETFSNLIGHEIDRIDSLVNQLLRFARPAKPHLKPRHVHEILDKSLTLIGHRLFQKEIKLTRQWEADVDTIRADADQLEQVFLNFFLNAIDAMKRGGELTVSTHICTGEELVTALAHGNGDGSAVEQEVLRITIRDTGEGIRSEDLPHVFDPFFSTKDYGTGLGLSVVHGIVQEHGGQIEVESELKKGTAFHILLPLVRFDSKVAAA
ncbi:MAG TPA: ATP-binding protein [Chthoniobacterales bacterium]|nr:ATP-binding protein [Chthoniobacterales bacterium]